VVDILIRAVEAGEAAANHERMEKAWHIVRCARNPGGDRSLMIR